MVKAPDFELGNVGSNVGSGLGTAIHLLCDCAGHLTRVSDDHAFKGKKLTHIQGDIF